MAKKNEIDSKITALFDVLHEQQIEVEKAEQNIKRSWKTNCSFVLPYSMQPTNIQVATKESIINMYADMLSIMDYRSKAAAELGVEVGKDWNGFSVDDWVADFKKRISSIDIKAQKAKLQSLEQRLDAIVSPEQRREMELEAILQEVG